MNILLTYTLSAFLNVSCLCLDIFRSSPYAFSMPHNNMHVFVQCIRTGGDGHSGGGSVAVADQGEMDHGSQVQCYVPGSDPKRTFLVSHLPHT